MKILVVGSGGREHALAWKVAQSPRVSKLYVAPGNGGTEKIAKNVPILATDIAALAEFAQDKEIDLTVVGPEAPLALGLVDIFKARGLRAFGPTAAAAAIEGSKVFSKGLMKKYGLPTASYEVFTNSIAAKAYIARQKLPLVVKADGLAAGKGVVIAQTKEEALDAVTDMLENQIFGSAGHSVVVEEFLQGEEVTVLALCDGKNILQLEGSQDHKRIFDGDQGPNTGGMGAYSPVPALTSGLADEVEGLVLRPAVEAMAAEGRPFSGVLYAGLMLTTSGPKVLEFNARFGDPEAQAVIPRLKTDLVDVLEAAVEGCLDRIKLEWHKKAALTVVLASGGYPGHYNTGYEITGIDEASVLPGTFVFHAGTKYDGQKLVTAGGRVLAVTALGSDLRAAQQAAYLGADKIHFEGQQQRRDIGWRSLPK